MQDGLTQTDRIDLPNGWHLKACTDDVRAGRYMALCWPDGSELDSLRTADAMELAYTLNRTEPEQSGVASLHEARRRAHDVAEAYAMMLFGCRSIGAPAPPTGRVEPIPFRRSRGEAHKS